MNNMDRESGSYEDQYSGPREGDFAESRGGSTHNNRVMMAPGSYQQTYQVASHDGFYEQALPSQYHATMRVATRIPPTSLRGI